METFTPKRILVPTDLSDLATAAVHRASSIATRFGSRLSILFADPFIPPMDFIEAPVASYMFNAEELHAAAETRLQSWVDANVPAEIPRHATVVVRTPADAILSTAASDDCDLIVMGTHGRSGWRRALLGSVAEVVLRETTRPVLTIREGDLAAAEKPFHRVLCPVNFTDVATSALEHAASFAKAFGAELLVLHVVEPDTGHDEEVGIEAIRAWVPAEIREMCWFRELVVHGHAAEQIVDFTNKVSADLIVVGAQHRRFADTTVIGTTTERITRHAPCPVLTVVREAVPRTKKVVEEEAALV